MDVIVIGCGAAGLAAMRKLHDAGLQVLGLEAADRIGGRVHSVEFNEKFIDLVLHGKFSTMILTNKVNDSGRPRPR